MEFVGEEGTGLGPTLEFFALVAAELQRKDLGLWLCDDENHHNDSDTLSTDEDDETSLTSTTMSNERLRSAGFYVTRSSGLFPAPLPQNSAACDRSVRYYWFLGVFLAKVLQDNRLVDLPLSRPFLKLMCRGDITNNVNERIGLTTSNVATQESMSSSMASSFISEEGEQDDKSGVSLRDKYLELIYFSSCNFEYVYKYICIFFQNRRMALSWNLRHGGMAFWTSTI